MAEVTSELKCPLCRSLYKDPYSLKICGHDVCLPCLQSLVSPVCFSGEDRVKFECPVEHCEAITYLAVMAIGNRIKIDFEASDEILPNETLGRIAQSFTQLEERLERERIERVEKERKIEELQNGRQSLENPNICKKHESQGMELNLYCVQCDVLLCHLCANKPHHKHGVIAASCRDEYLEKKGQIIQNMTEAQLCVDVIGSEVKSQGEVVKHFEDEIAPVAGRMNETKTKINDAIKKLQDFYKNLEDQMEDIRSKVKEPMLDASKLLRELVEEITNARTNLEYGLVRKFEASNARLKNLQGRKIKEANVTITRQVQQVETELGYLEKIGDDIKRYVDRSIGLHHAAVTLEDSENTPTSTKNMSTKGDLGGSDADTRDLDGALVCNHNDYQKKAYITSLGLGPRELSPPPVEKVDIGVQYNKVEVSDSWIQVNPEDIENLMTGRGKKRDSDLSVETPVDKSRRISANDSFVTALDESINAMATQLDNTLIEEGMSDMENEDTTYDYRHLLYDPDEVVTGKFVLVSHADEQKYPWIGKVINCSKKNVRVRWYKGKLNEHWSVDSKYLESLARETIHASFSCEEEGSQFLMDRSLSLEIEHLMSTL